MTYLCKWGELPYTETTWETESILGAYPSAISSYWIRETEAASRRRGESGQQKIARKEENFYPFSEDPPWLTGGALYPYQLAALNWLRSSWYKHTNVILADEMGLGKTIQSSAFLLSLTEA